MHGQVDKSRESLVFLEYFQLSSLKMLNFLTTFDKQFCASTKPGDYYDKFMILSCPPPPQLWYPKTETQRID